MAVIPASEAIPKETLRAVRRLELVTRRLVQEVLSGGYLSSFLGSGMEFSEVREYHEGDDVRHIDWNVTARLDRAHVKRFVEERELRLVFLVDGSASTSFGSGDRSKSEVASELCAAVALSAHRNRDLVGLVRVSDRVEAFVPPRKGRTHVLRILRELLVPRPPGAGTKLAAGAAFLLRVLRRRSTVLVVSDFQDDGYETPLRLLRRRHDVIAVSVRDPREDTLPSAGVLELEDPETGERVLLDTGRASVRREFARRAAERESALSSVLRRAAVDRIDLATDRPVVPALLRFFRARARRRSRGR